MSPTRPKVLVAPLDWGLGHTTRCISIINELNCHDCEVVIASSAMQKKLLAPEFPQLRFIDLPPYGLKYGKTRWSTRLNLFLQTAKIVRRIRAERNWLQKLLATEPFDLLISDNRYGLFADGLITVFITHQLQLHSGLGNYFDRKISSRLFRYIDHFSFCWIPDQESLPYLAGSLSHPESFPQTHLRYIGPLLRFRKLDLPLKKNSLLIILSGPEPQRSIFERIIIMELSRSPQQCTLVRGLPESESSLSLDIAGLKSYNHLPTDQLNQYIGESEFILSRSGYSSIMELVSLGKKCIMVPTPGQGEQEYLANYLHKQRVIMKADQSRFHLSSCLEDAQKFPYRLMNFQEEGALKRAIGEALQAAAEGERQKLNLVSQL